MRPLVATAPRGDGGESAPRGDRKAVMSTPAFVMPSEAKDLLRLFLDGVRGG